MQDDRARLIPGLALAVVGLWLYVVAWRRMRRESMIRNLPTSRIRSVAMGMAEICGRIKLTAADPAVSPVRRLSCGWWRVTVVRRSVSGDGRRTTTDTVLDLSASVPFHLEDDTGRMLVLPAGAEITGDPFCDVSLGGMQSAGDDDVHVFLRSKGLWPASASVTYRVREWALLADAPAYILGEVALPGPGAAAERRRRLGERLRQRAGDPAARATADANRDGVIQPEEWDAAKERAQRELLAEDAAAGTPDPVAAVAIRRPRDGFFLISAGSEKEALARHGWGGVMLGAGAAALLGAGYLLLPWLKP